MKHNIFLFLSICLTTTAIASPCKKTQKKYLEQRTQLRASDRFNAFLEYRGPIIVAHGYHKNVAPQSTWRHFSHTLAQVKNLPIVIEMDVRDTLDYQFVINHDPTWHNVMQGFRTPETDYMRVAQRFPGIFDKRYGLDSGLVSETATHTLSEIKRNMSMYDEHNNFHYNVISLEEMLAAVNHRDKVVIPRHHAYLKGNISDPYTRYVIHRATTFMRTSPVLLYLDCKPINHLARRLYGLSDWHWIKNYMSVEQLTQYTQNVIKGLARILARKRVFGRAFVAARHPKIATMLRRGHTHFNVMISPDTISAETTVPQLIAAFETFPPPIKLVEIKHLSHFLDPELHRWANNRNIKLFFNQIENVDPQQFRGPYEGNLLKLLNDIFENGDAFFIQTNTVNELRDYINKRKQGHGSP